ncbi:MAG TPA: response regulator transcription factor [Glaciibacter sp.]|nr:response regulator transcription factor [Glaciibacter sp.]
MSGSVIRVAIADDHDLFREGIVAIFQQDSRLLVVAQASDGDAALAVAVDDDPDIILVDVEMPGPPVMATVRRIRRLAPRSKIVILTMHRDSVLRSELHRAGVSAFLTKTMPSADLRVALHRVADANPQIGAAARTDPTRGSEPRSLISRREHEVLRLIARAYSNAEIATVMSITEGTVKRHTSNLYAKLGAGSRMDAVHKATRVGLLESGV